MGVSMTSGQARASDFKTGFVNRVLKDSNGAQSKNGVFVPRSYTGSEPVPLILFLHGMGESGDDGQRQTKVGLGPAIRKREKEFPFLAVFPQSQKKTWQAG